MADAQHEQTRFRVAARLFAADASSDVAFGTLRALCGDPGRPLVVSRYSSSLSRRACRAMSFECCVFLFVKFL